MKKIQLFIIALFASIFNTNAIEMPLIDEDDNLDNLLGVEVQVDENGELVDEDSLLLGLGRLFRKSTFERQKATKIYNRIMSARRRKKRLNHLKRSVTKGQSFIVGNLSKLPVEMQADIKSKNAKFQDQVMYLVSTKKTISSITDLINKDTQLTTGYSSFEDNGKVPIGRTMSVDYIQFFRNQFEKEEGVFSERWSNASYHNLFASCDLEIIQGGNVLVRIPVHQLNELRNLENGATPNNQYAGYNLKQRLLVVPGIKMQFRIITPDDVTISASDGNLLGMKVVLYGDGTTTK